MSKMCRRLSFWALTLLLALSIPAEFAFSQDVNWSVDDWHDYSTILRQKLPTRKELGTFIGFRYSESQTPGDLEYSFLMQYELPGGRPMTADVSSAFEKSIIEQLRDLQRQYPQRKILDLVDQLKFRSSHLTEIECPVIRKQFEIFTKLKLPTPVFDVILLDQPNHEFDIRSSLEDFNLSVRDGRYPLVIWANETKRALDACIPTQTSKIKK